MESLSLLIIDDEPAISGFIKMRLGLDAPHFRINTLESGEECLDYLKENQVDCILSDYQMPVMDGMQLLEAIREGGSDIPFIFITGQGSEEVAREAFKKGANDYFTKDIGFAHFPRIINSIEQAVKNREANCQRAKAEAALLEEKNKLEAILAGMGDGISIQNLDYKVLYQNDAHRRIVGDHAGEYCYEAYEGMSQTCEGCPVALAFADGKFHTVERRVDRESGVLHVEITASPLRDASGKIIAGIEVVRNITNRKLMEEAQCRAVTERKEAQERIAHLNRLNSMISGINKAIVRTHDGKLLMEEACKIMVEEGLFLMAWIGIVNPDDLSVTPAAKWGNEEGYLDGISLSAKDEPFGRGPVGVSIRTHEPAVINDIDADCRMAPWREKAISKGYKSVASFPLITGGRAVGAFTVYSREKDFFNKDEVALLLGLAEDISFALEALEHEQAAKAAEYALKESERRYKDLVELSTDFIYRSDKYGRQLFMNDAAYRVLEATPEEVDGQPWQKWIHPDDLKHTMEVFGEMMAKGMDAFNYENRFVSKSGKVINVLHNVRVLRDENGAVIGTQGIARDITDRKAAEKALKEAQEDRSAVFHMLTHDIRGPLSVIYGCCEMLKPDGGETTPMLDEIFKAAKRISLLIDDMLAVSRLESGAGLMLQPVYPEELIEQAVKDCEVHAKEDHVEIKIKVEPDTPRIYADSAQIRRAVTNLLSNAVKYNKKGGTATVRVGALPDDLSKIFIEVSDDGDGIDSEDLPRLFSKYYRGKNAGKRRGTGLGLSIVKAAVDAHGGTVKVSTTDGEGSAFTIILPVKPGIDGY